MMITKDIDRLKMRRDILDWRDKYLVLVESHFEKHLSGLLKKVDMEIERLANRGLTLRIFEKRVWSNTDRLFTSWGNAQVEAILAQAQSDLSTRMTVHQKLSHNEQYLGVHPSYDDSNDTVLSVASISAGAVAIPAVASMSTVSAGGIAGFFGATVIAWPVVLVGGAIALGLMRFGAMKQRNQVKVGAAAEAFKTRYRVMIRKQVLCNKASKASMCGHLQMYIDQTANTLLEDIKP